MMLLFKISGSHLPAFPLIRRTLTTIQLVYNEYGDPEKVLKQVSSTLDPHSLSENATLLQFLAAPIHPADINTVQGIYAIKPKLPAVPGNEGVAKVIACGSKVSHLAVNDLVIPATLASGTWRTHAIYPASDLIKINPNLPITTAATLSTNPSTAYRMLKDFVELSPGDTVVQNGATSAVGAYVMQLARLWNLNTVNLFRQRSTPAATEETRQSLLKYGGTLALTEEELKTELGKEDGGALGRLGPVRLAFNCVGGRSILILLRSLAPGGVLVSYGAMNRQPMQVPVAPFIFNDVSLRGFWLSSWLQRNPHSPQRSAMLSTLTDMFLDGQLRPSPFEVLRFEDWRMGIERALFKDAVPVGLAKKYILMMQ